MKTWKLFAALVLGGALWLQATPAAAHRTRPCRDDVQRLCGDDQYSRAGIASCLERHVSELDPACLERFTKTTARIDAFHQACGADVQSLCPTADWGRKTFQCLRDHESNLSQPCKDKIAEIRERHHDKCHHHKGAPDNGESAS